MLGPLFNALKSFRGAKSDEPDQVGWSSSSTHGAQSTLEASKYTRVLDESISNITSDLQDLSLTQKEDDAKVPGSFPGEPSTDEPTSVTALTSNMGKVNSVEHAVSSFRSGENSRSSNLSVSMPEEIVSRPIEEGDSMRMLETHLTAAAITTTPSSRLDRQNKLFVSAPEHHRNVSDRMPANFDVRPADMIESVHTVLLKIASPASRPGQRFGRRTAPAPIPLSPPSTSSTRSRSRSPTPPQKKVLELEFNALRSVEAQVIQHHNDILSSAFSLLPVDDQCARLNTVSNFLRKAADDIQSYESREKERIRKSRAQVPNEKLAENRARVQRSLRNLQLEVTTLYAPLLLEVPENVSSEHIYNLPVNSYDPINQVLIILAVVCNVIIGLSIPESNFVLGVCTLLVRMVMSMCKEWHGGEDSEFRHDENSVLAYMPKSLNEALKEFNLDGTLELYAACPKCNYTNRASGERIIGLLEFPETCSNRIVGKTGHSPCDAPLLQRRNGIAQPIKPYLVGSLSDYIARCLADPVFVEQSNDSIDNAFRNICSSSTSNISSVFDAEFMKDFRGPDGRLFVDRGRKIRLPFSIHFDFFNPKRITHRGNHNSIGIISAANLALDPTIRYLPEYMFLGGVVPGPSEPPEEQSDHYVRPIMEQFKRAWRPGFRVSHVATPEPSVNVCVECGVVLSVNDLPGARKFAGLSGHNSGNFICSVCGLRGKQEVFSTKYDSWVRRNSGEMRYWAEKWRDADTLDERESIYNKYGVRWSSVWLLEYWDPTRMLVIDSMHCLLEGLVHYHCRHVLRLDRSKPQLTEDGLRYAFDWPWIPYDDSLAGDTCRVERNHITDVAKLHGYLCLALEGDNSLTLNELWTRVENNITAPALRYVTRTLEIPERLHVSEQISTLYVQRSQRAQLRFKSKRHPAGPILFPSGAVPTNKNHYIALLLNWRLKQDLSYQSKLISTGTPETLKHIQRIIKDTEVPSWINSVPKNYGEAGAGSIKADEWRTLSTIYLPIALVILWGDVNGGPPPRDDSEKGLLFKALDHSMALFQATILACRYTMSHSRIKAYRECLTEWIEQLRPLYPFTREGPPRPNIHAACHIFDFLLLFGPVISWWTFPFERLIGTLQKINTNDHIGGMMESTIMRSQCRAANLRRWLRRADCPEALKQLKILFDKTFIPANSVSASNELIEVKGSHRAYLRDSEDDKVKYSPRTTHQGNSNILYRVQSDITRPCAGSIELIENVRTPQGTVSKLHVRRHLPLSGDQYDPFQHYRHLHAHTFSSTTKDILDVIDVEDIISHAARLDYSYGRTVFLKLSRA